MQNGRMRIAFSEYTNGVWTISAPERVTGKSRGLGQESAAQREDAVGSNPSVRGSGQEKCVFIGEQAALPGFEL